MGCFPFLSPKPISASRKGRMKMTRTGPLPLPALLSGAAWGALSGDIRGLVLARAGAVPTFHVVRKRKICIFRSLSWSSFFKIQLKSREVGVGAVFPHQPLRTGGWSWLEVCAPGS